ncbi:MAG: DUF760 domain-containing protein [Oscillatoria sp. PMC 1068.18]|nr:DUF760 domain-containing protein [Oscillatoria sp. PMC 1076.18]MEC4987342.1 DUF760 domain-containing protein [Oscillatoria sp. PMC 1068.18]
MIFDPNFRNSEAQEQEANPLWEYLQQQSPEILEQVAQSATPNIRDIIAQNVEGLVGGLPTGDFQVQIATDRENLANLLASAMMTGYFLRKMEQRMELDETLSDSDF